MSFGNIEKIVFEIIGKSASGEATLSKMQKRLATFGAALTATSASGLAAMFKLGEGGAALEGIERKFARMTKAFGKNAGEMLGDWQEASRGVVDEAELMSKANALALAGIDPMKEMGWMLNSVATAAEATGKGFSELYEQLALGLARGSAARLDDLGLIVSEAEAKERYAKSIGVEANQLSREQQQLAILTATREAAARQSEFFGEVTETNATKIARARASIRNMGNDIKKLFAPAAGRMADLLTSLIGLWDRIPEPIKRAVASIAVAGAGLGAVAGPVITVIGMLPKLKAMLGSVSAGLKMLGISGAASLGPILPIIAGVVAAIVALAAVGKMLARGWKEDWGGLRTTVEGVIAYVKPTLDQIMQTIRFWANQIKQSFAALKETFQGLVRNTIEPFFARLRGLFQGGVGIREFLLTINDAAAVVLSTFQSLLESLRLLLEGRADQAMVPLRDAALNVVTMIVLVWRKHVKGALQWGWNLIVSFGQGIVNAGRTVLKQAVTFIGTMISRFLASFSPPKEGPLASIVKWGKNLMDTYLQSFALADFGILRDTLAPIRSALETAVSLGDMDQDEMLGTFREVRAEVAQVIAGFRETGQVNEEVLSGIAERLGEGGEEYTKYIRLTLEHQKAMKNLQAVQSEVADAEAAGFIPDALRQKLESAEGEAQAAEDAVSWQQEYLAALQDGADIQREMVDAMSELADKVSGVSDALSALSNLQVGGEGAKVGLDLEFGGFSEEFQGIRGEVEGFFSTLPQKAQGYLNTAKTKIATWFDEGKRLVAQKFGEWWEDLKEVPILGTLLEFLETKIPEGIATLQTVWDETLIPMWERGRRFLEEDLHPLFDALRELLEVTVLKAAELLAGAWSETLLPALQDVWDFVEEDIKPIFDEIVTFINDNFVKAIEALDSWLGTTLLESWNTLIDALSNAKLNILDPVLLVFDNLTQSAKNWLDYIVRLKEKFEGWTLPKWAQHNSPSPIEMTFAGAAENVKRLTGLLPAMQRALNFQLGISDLVPASATTGGQLENSPVVVIQIGEQSFPNVRDGRDAGGFLRELLDEVTQSAGLHSIVPGGV